jgi:DNA topoisomerase-1
MTKNLVIVESPAKAKTIEGFLGKDFVVKSSFGHVRDLPKSTLGVDVDKDFIPHYEIPADKKAIVNELIKSAKDAEFVWLATDEDREGEAIAWHLAEAINVKESKQKRIVFHEITKDAILNAIKTPRSININLVDAQQARRVLDRLVGFEISPILWRKVKPALSAGRVQSVAVRLIVEREKEIEGYTTTSAFRVEAVFQIAEKDKKGTFKAELSKRFEKKEEALAFLKKCIDSKFTIESIETKPAKKSPAPPFTTSTLQQEASRKLGFSVAKTMMVAQQLYESGKITYMRTDSVNLSDTAVKMAKDEITAAFGKEYVKTRKYTTKTKGAQEAHEAIRPSYMNKHSVDGDPSQKRLYELIWKRTIASQMSDASIEKTIITIDVSKADENFISKGEIIKFDGFLKVYLESTDDDENEKEEGLLPKVAKGEKLNLSKAEATERFTIHPPRYTEASLVKKLEELGIGRPSTYAPIISTIQKRGYVVNEDREGRQRNYNYILLENKKISESVKTENTGQEKSKLFPTDIGIIVNNFLVQYFDNILDYNFTANVEKEFDEIAQGAKVWNKMIKKFYTSFHKQVEETMQKSEKVSGERLLGIDTVSGKNIYVRLAKFGPVVMVGKNDDEEKPKFVGLKKGQSIETLTLEEALELINQPYTNNERLLGKDEVSGKNVYVRIGRYGPMAQIGETDDEEKPKYASLKKGQNIDSVNLSDVMILFSLPRIVGVFEGEEMTVAIGRFGPYVKHAKSFYSLAKTDDPYSIETGRAIEIIEEKRKKEKEKIVKEFDKNKDVKILNGKYGVYLSVGKQNYKLPKEVDPEKITLEECLKIAEETPASKPRSFKRKFKK